MIRIENLLTDAIKWSGNWGNLREPHLTFKEINVKENRIIFQFAKDYSSRIDSIEIIDDSKIPFDKGIGTIESKENVLCYLSTTKANIKTFVSDMVVFGITKNKEKFQNISFERNDLRSNISVCSYTFNYALGEFIIPIDVQARINTNIGVDDATRITSSFVRYVKELGMTEQVIKKTMKVLSIKQGDYKNLCECFDYEIIDDETVILHLKKDIDPKYLLRFKGFNDGFTDFKIWTNGHNGTFTMIKGDSYFTVTWGNSTTCCSDYIWDMKKEIMNAIKIKTLMF